MSTDSSAPSSATQQALAGAFIAIKAGNKAILLQPKMPVVDVKGLETVNDSLATAQAHATYWTNVLSANVQNELQHIIDYNALYAPLATSINAAISNIKAATPDRPPTTDMQNLAGYFQALQMQVQQLLYGTGGDASNPMPNSALGTYNALTAYQQNVAADKQVFDGYASLAFNEQSGVNAEIAQYQSDIDADNKAIAKDQAMIAGGAAMIVTGILICCVAVALAPETGGMTVAAIGVFGVATIAGGAVMTGVAAHDLDGKQQDVVKKTKLIANDQTELASLASINHSSTQVALQAENIYGALDTILTNWQQLNNDLSNVIGALNLPETELMGWIQKQQPGQDPSYSVMGTILSAMFGTADSDWATASTTAQTLLQGLANVVEFSLPAAASNTDAPDGSMQTIASAAPQQKAA